MKYSKTLALFIMLLGLGACSTYPAPNEEYVLAKVALDSARTVESARHSPGHYHQAEEFFRRGKTLYEEREYEDAKSYFIKSRQAAEKAENSARLIRFKNGEVL